MTLRNGSHYFTNSSNPVFSNTTFTHISGDAYSGSSERYGLKLLLANISTGAFHDAAERGDPPRCHPHTRTAIRAEIMEWIQCTSVVRKLILWMYGPAGSGKTAIAQSIAEICKKKGLLAASFFFGRTAAGRNDNTRFVATIAYQLSRSIPEISDHIISAIEKDPTIFSLALATQMRVLVIEPLKSLPPSPTPILVITDGVDECGPGPKSQADLLTVLGTASELQHVPLIFLVASRPEYEIREAFNGNCLNSLVKSLVLDDNYKPNNDIRLYLNSMFKKIHDQHVRLGSRFPSPWPRQADVDSLVAKASGQFIFASTVIKFIDSSRYHPPARLDIILGLLVPGNETPFALLDAVYHFILSSVADSSKVLEILTLLIIGNNLVFYKDMFRELSVEVIEELLGLTVGTAMVDMHALVHVPPSDDRTSELRIHHASLYDFLMDRSRSQDYYIDITQGHITLSRHWLKLIANYPHIPPSFSLSTCIFGFISHCEKLSTSSSDIASDLASLSLKKLLERICSADDLYSPYWYFFFKTAKEQAGTRADVFPRLRDEFDAFVFECVLRYPPALQYFIPTLLVYGSGSELMSKCDEILCLLLYTTHPSLKKIDEICQLDSTLLHLYSGHSSPYQLSFLFWDPSRRSRAGQFYVDDGSFAALLKQIIKMIYPNLAEEAKYEIKFVKHKDGCKFIPSDSRPTIHINIDNMAKYWFPSIVRLASGDLELAELLRERILQYPGRQFRKEEEIIAKIGLEYIKRCGIPYLEHTHPPTTNNCIICAEDERTEAECIEEERRAEAKRAKFERRVTFERFVRAPIEKRIERK